MADAPRTHAGGRRARLLALCALTPAIVHAQQAPACTAHAPRLFSSEYYAAPVAVVTLDDAVLVLGTPAYHFSPAGQGGVKADTSIAGVIRDAAGKVTPIPRPPGSLAFVHPRALRRPDGDVIVVWSEPDVSRGGTDDGVPQRLMSGTLRGASWHAVASLGTVEPGARLMREVASDLVRVQGVTYLAFTPERTGTRPEIEILSDSGGRWRRHRFAFELSVIGAVELGESDGRLQLLFAAIPRAASSDRPVTVGTSLWTSRLLAAGLSAPIKVAGDGNHAIGSPRLLHGTAGTIASWIRDTPEGPVLEWRALGSSGEAGPVHRLPDARVAVQGQAPLRDLIGVVRASGEGQPRGEVLRLRRDGFELLTGIPLEASLPPVAFGAPSVAGVLGVASVPTPDPGPFRLVAYDLRCALRR